MRVQTTGQGYAGKPVTRPLTLRLHMAAPPDSTGVRDSVFNDRLWSPDGKNHVQVNVPTFLQERRYAISR